MKSLFRAAADLEAFLIERRWQYCFIGGIALQRWGQPRLTNDIDLTILAGSRDGIPIDVALGGIDFEQRAVSRATRFEFVPGVSLLTCSAEDLIVLKAFANRPRDWADVETIVTRQQNRLDSDYLFGQLEPLCQIKGAPEIVDQLRRLMTR